MSLRTRFRKTENIVLVLFAAFFSFLFYVASTSESYNFDGIASMTFPKWIIGFTIFLSVLKLGMNLCAKSDPSEESEVEEAPELVDGLSHQASNRKKLISLVGIVIYAFLWNFLGFGLSTVLFVTLESHYLRPKTPFLKCLLVGVGATLVLYFVFGFLFNVDFPEPILELILD